MQNIYLDTNVWCRPFDLQEEERIQKESEALFKVLERAYYQNKYRIIGSLILDDEIEQIQGKEKRKSVEAIIDLFVKKKINWFSKSLFIEIKKLGIKDKDALHLAFAVGNSEYFITCDDEILSKKEEISRFNIKVVNPVEFIEGV